MTTRASAYLVLEDGRVFPGQAYGSVGESFGEAVFATGMTGYQETLTDPSYHRQVVAMTASHIGNTGVNDEDDESDRIWPAGLVIREPARLASNWRSRQDLESRLAAEGVVGVCDVDTRALTRHLRERGVMRAAVSSTAADPAALARRVQASPSMAGANLVDQVSVKHSYVAPPTAEKRFTVAALDFGMKRNIVHSLAARGVQTHVLPAWSSAAEVLAVSPDAVLLPNGPGDPATADRQVETVRGLLARATPIFGICFGNQVLGRALGLSTYKLKYGHRGLNLPVADVATGKVAVTAHNHGFALAAPQHMEFDTDFGRAHVSHVCLNDDVVEGVRCTDVPAFSVQYHPEAAAGPRDADYLFDSLIDLIGESGRA